MVINPKIRKIIDISNKEWKIPIFNTHLYLRLLELGSVISEEWGEAIKEINDFLWHGNDIKHLENALKEIDQVYNPLEELKLNIKLSIEQIKELNKQ